MCEFFFCPRVEEAHRGCGPADDRAIWARGSVVVVTPADIVVMERSVVGRLAGEGALGVSSVETVFEDRRDRAVGGRTDVVAAPAGRFDARWTVALHQADDARDTSGSPARDAAWPS